MEKLPPEDRELLDAKLNGTLPELADERGVKLTTLKAQTHYLCQALKTEVYGTEGDGENGSTKRRNGRTR